MTSSQERQSEDVCLNFFIIRYRSIYRVTGTLLSGGRGHESQVAQEPPPPSPEWYHPLNTDGDTHFTVKMVSLLRTPTIRMWL